MPPPNGESAARSVTAVERIAPALTRAGVTLILAIVFSLGFLRGLIDGGNFTTVVGMVMAFWFGSRQDERRRSTDDGAPSQTASATTAGAAPATATVTTNP